MENKPRNEEEAQLLLYLLLLQLEREQADNYAAVDHENERLTTIMHEVANYRSPISQYVSFRLNAG